MRSVRVGVGWRWKGGGGDADDTATDIAHACGPVHLDPTTEEYVGAHKLSMIYSKTCFMRTPVWRSRLDVLRSSAANQLGQPKRS